MYNSRMASNHLIIMIVVGVLLTIAWIFRPINTEFADIHDAKIQLQERGFHCVIVSGNPQKLVVSRSSTTYQDAKEYALKINGIHLVKGKVVMLNATNNANHDEPRQFFGMVEAIGDDEILSAIQGKQP